MVKDTSSTTSSKKRKSTTEAEADIDIYKKVVEFEEKEAALRSMDEDTQLFFDTCENIRSFLGEIFKYKSESKKDNKQPILEKRTQACVLTSLLKKLNRLEKVRMLTARETLSQEKQKLDSVNLQFQNLLYELAHLVSEYEKCKQYKSKDEDIELISVEQFLKDAPEEVTEKFKDMDDSDNNMKHELHLAMLEHELSQRIQLNNLCGILENEKKDLAKDIVSRKEKLEGLGPRLTAVIEATKPLQDHLGLPIDKIRAEHKLASLLSDELYLFYCNGDAYRQVNDLGMTIEIVGDSEEAVQYNESENNPNDADSEPEQEVEEQAEGKKRRHRKPSQVDKHEEKKKKVLEAHPLSIEVTMKVQNGPSLKIKFQHRSQLNIVTVTSNVDIPAHITGTSAREVLFGESILNELFEADFGKDSPNSSNHYQLKKVGLGSYESLIPKLGYAYHWAQKICGLDFLDAQYSKDKACKIGQKNVESVLKALHKRIRARYALAEQLQQLEQNCISAIPEHIEYPKTAASTLTKWISISYQKFCQITPNALSLVENEIAGINDLYYSVTIARPKAMLFGSVIIKNDYPQRPPIFVLSLKFSGEYNAGNSDEIRDMERAVNIGWESTTNNAGWLLSVQLRYLCSFLDVYLETTEGSGFGQSTVFFKNVCGRNRRRPYKFRKIGNGIFTQY